MLRPLVTVCVATALLLAGCQHSPPQHYGMFRRPGWWERRMDRLDTWNRRNGYPLDKAKDGTVAAAGYTILGAAAVAGIILIAALPDEKTDRNQPLFPYQD